MATLEELTKRVEALEKENTELKARVDALSASSAASARMSTMSSTPSDSVITNEAVSDMLSGVIDSFNSKANKDDSPVGYMMSEVEINLKATADMKSNQLQLKPLDPSTPAGNATEVRMAVKAVPGNTVSKN